MTLAVLAGCATEAPKKVAGPVAAPATPAAPLAPPRQAFADWLKEVKAEALADGVRPQIVEAAFANVKFDDTVVKSDQNQPEVKQTLDTYLSKRITPAQIAKGREMMKTYRKELQQVSRVYGVPPRFIVAIWGIETNYGSFTGGQNVFQSLSTLAYDSRRKEYFRNELFNALKIANDNHIKPEQMTGSWAGALGQPQFMPSSFLVYAVDFNKDGRRDIWNTPVDVFASISNYFQSTGWANGQNWGREVILSKPIKDKLVASKLQPPARSCGVKNHQGNMTVTEWGQYGVADGDGKELPRAKVPASLAQPDGVDGRAFLAYANYRVFLRYNCSDYYAIAVGLLSDQFKDLD
ncbi:lytic murein transglycosylase [Govanella unica]|uniref:Lytic murein transglycosylase n=1 Tax=Govanella unica TaxID=2975056 RepID=A0A9X3TXZ6_9PROT|nr:lytic murein transglycosylase [Govania unica]MDA5193856.1 lytic murein transglycosylase [Govania unica]